MNCESHELQISRLTDGESSVEESAEIFGHLGGCMSCREFFFQLQRLNGSLERSSKAKIPTTFEKSVQTTTKMSNNSQSMWGRKVAVRFPIAILVVFVLFFGIFFLIQSELKLPNREMVYLVNLPEVVISSNAAENTNLK